MKILIIEDDPKTARAIHAGLAAEGYPATRKSRPQSAMEGKPRPSRANSRPPAANRRAGGKADRKRQETGKPVRSGKNRKRIPRTDNPAETGSSPSNNR